jgi:hypothetical protein
MVELIEGPLPAAFAKASFSLAEKNSCLLELIAFAGGCRR